MALLISKLILPPVLILLASLAVQRWVTRLVDGSSGCR
jgi:hypothetical protein